MKIDTNTTAGKIAVMQAYEDGKEIEIIKNGVAVPLEHSPKWDWLCIDYRIKPQTVEQAANKARSSRLCETENESNNYKLGFIHGAK